MKEDLKSLEEEERSLKERVEDLRKEHEFFDAFVKVMEGEDVPERLKAIERIKMVADAFLMRPKLSKVDVEVAKMTIVKYMMPRFRWFDCRNCKTRFFIDSPEPIDSLWITCPKCKFSSYLSECKMD